MIREDRKLLAELAQPNTAMTPLAMRVMDGGTSVAEQQDYTQCLIAAGEQSQRRADWTAEVIKSEVLVSKPPTLLRYTGEPTGKREHR